MARVKLGYEERGIASWYGVPYHGRQTASGEIYDMERLTAAHPRLPFGVTTRVDNLSNGKHVEVRINDRGPFVGGRIIDLSRAAARQIDLLGPGITRVRLKVIAAPASVRAGMGAGTPPSPRFAFLLHPIRSRRERAFLASLSTLAAPDPSPRKSE
ncbi:MAG: septal ring lytic transglycosylase RlpA family protein [Bryobacteraceae bacterium]|nr:septal ring lytic transglycosylase RlpA family protein [Bryobacteraceae bacterium]